MTAQSMPLILAIVADQQQAAQLAALLDRRLAVDLVYAGEVGEGLLALGERIPDLILTSPWMSPFDNGVLDEYLRDLGPAGAHVQTLRIPVLSQAPKKVPRLGFSLRGRVKSEPTTPDGCEPKLFADEIAFYLARAAEEKLHVSTNESAPVIERRAVQEQVTAHPITEPQWRPAYSFDADDETAAWTVPEPEPDASAWRSDLLDRAAADELPTAAAGDDLDTPIYRSVTSRTSIEVEPDSASVDTPVLDAATAAIVASLEEPAVAEQLLVPAVEESRGVAETRAGAIEELPVDPVEPRPAALIGSPSVADAALVKLPVVEKAVEKAAVVAPASAAQMPAPLAAKNVPDSHKATQSFKTALAAIRAAWGKPSSKKSSSEPMQAALASPKERPSGTPDVATPLEVDLTGAVDQLDESTAEREDSSVASVQRPFEPGDSPDAPEVYELPIESDMNELESELFISPPAESTPATMIPDAASAPSLREPSEDRREKAAKSANQPVKTKVPRPSQPKSAQDEWGVFDPSRCGFAALVDKLDEEVSTEKGKQPRNSVKSRVLSWS